MGRLWKIDWDSATTEDRIEYLRPEIESPKYVVQFGKRGSDVNEPCHECGRYREPEGACYFLAVRESDETFCFDCAFQLAPLLAKAILSLNDANRFEVMRQHGLTSM